PIADRVPTIIKMFPSSASPYLRSTERTSAGREAARKRGVRFGRPRKLSVDQEQLARRLVLEGRSVSDIARTFKRHEIWHKPAYTQRDVAFCGSQNQVD